MISYLLPPCILSKLDGYASSRTSVGGSYPYSFIAPSWPWVFHPRIPWLNVGFSPGLIFPPSPCLAFLSVLHMCFPWAPPPLTWICGFLLGSCRCHLLYPAPSSPTWLLAAPPLLFSFLSSWYSTVHPSLYQECHTHTPLLETLPARWYENSNHVTLAAPLWGNYLKLIGFSHRGL